MAQQAQYGYKAHRGQEKPKEKKETKEEKNKRKLENDRKKLERLQFANTNRFVCSKGYKTFIEVRNEYDSNNDELCIGICATQENALGITHEKFITNQAYRPLYSRMTNNEYNYQTIEIINNDIITANNNNNGNNYRNEIRNVLNYLNNKYDIEPFPPTLEIHTIPIYTARN